VHYVLFLSIPQLSEKALYTANATESLNSQYPAPQRYGRIVFTENCLQCRGNKKIKLFKPENKKAEILSAFLFLNSYYL
jgi:hypothetical protein